MIEDLVHTDFKAVDKRDHVSSLYGWLRGEIDRVPIVFDREKPYGVVNERGFMKSHVSRDAKIEQYVVGTKTVSSDSPLDRVMSVIATSRIAHVPVTGENGQGVKGYVSAKDVLLANDVPSDVKISTVLTEVPTLTEDNGINQAIHYFRDVASHILPVVNQAGHLVGVVRRRDMLPFVTNARHSGRKPATGEMVDPRDPPVDGYLSNAYDVVRPDTPLRNVREDLARFGFLVVEDAQRKVLGVVTPENAVAMLSDR